MGTIRAIRPRPAIPVSVLAPALGVLLCCLTLIVVACGSSGPLNSEDVSGSWTSRYLEGWIDLELRSDGTYEESLYGFESGVVSLEEQNHTGTWTVVNDAVVLAAPLDVIPEPIGENDFKWKYAVGSSWELDAVHGLLGGVSHLEIEEVVSFKRVEEKEME